MKGPSRFPASDDATPHVTSCESAMAAPASAMRVMSDSVGYTGSLIIVCDVDD